MSENPITKLYVLNEDGETYSAIEPSTVAQAVEDETNNDTVQAYIDSTDEKINAVSDRVTALETIFDEWSENTFKYMGEWDCSNQTDFSTIDLPVKIGYAYKVIGSGASFDGRTFAQGDMLIIIEDVAKNEELTSSKLMHIMDSKNVQIKLDSVVIDTLPTYADLQNYGDAQLNSIIIVANDERHDDALSFYKYISNVIYDISVNTYADLAGLDFGLSVPGYTYIIDDVNDIITLETYVGSEINIPVPYVRNEGEGVIVRVISDETHNNETSYYRFENNSWVYIPSGTPAWNYMFSRREVFHNVYTVKGSVATYNDLPSSGNEIGDVWNVLDTGANYVWTENGWDKLSETIDMSEYTKTVDLATVALTGNYSDLSGKPTIPTVNDSTITFMQGDINRGYITLNQGTDATITFSAGESQVDWSDITNKPDFADVAMSGDYDDLDDKPTIGSGTLTIQKNGTTVGTFSANATEDSTINILADTQIQSDWEQEDDTKPDYIKNKPDLDAFGYHPTLFTFQWSDAYKNDIQWLRADTFSWHNGELYTAAYEHLVDDLQCDVDEVYYIMYDGDNINDYNRDPDSDTTSTSSVTLYAWTNENDETIYTLSDTPSINDSVYLTTDTSSSSNHVTEYDVNDVYTPTLTPQTETIGSTTIEFYRADDKHKIVLPTQLSKVMDIYDEVGVAWYYVLDLNNARFKLPRSKFGFTGLRDESGNYVEPGLPNITGSISSPAQLSNPTDAFTSVSGNASTWQITGPIADTFTATFNASASNPIYGASDTVQPSATQMYLYFYVGQYTQEAIEQTAGVTTEVLNEKADLTDISNATITFTQSGEIKGTITLNQMNNATIALASGGSGGTVDWSDITNKPTFANVATTGEYTDILNTPTIPTITMVKWTE